MKKILSIILALSMLIAPLSISATSTETQTNYAGEGRDAYEQSVYDTAIKLVDDPRCDSVSNIINTTRTMIEMSGFSFQHVADYELQGEKYEICTVSIPDFEPDRTKYVFFHNNAMVIDDGTITELAKYAYVLEWEKWSTGVMVNEAIPAMSKDEWKLDLVEDCETAMNFFANAAGTLMSIAATGGTSATLTASRITKEVATWTAEELVKNFLDIEKRTIATVTVLYFDSVNELETLSAELYALSSNKTEEGVNAFCEKASELHRKYEASATMIDVIAELNHKDAGEIFSKAGIEFISGFTSGLCDDILANAKNAEKLKEIYGSTEMVNYLLDADFLLETMSFYELVDHLYYSDIIPILSTSQSAMHDSQNSAYDAINSLCMYTRNFIYNTVKEDAGEYVCYNGNMYRRFDNICNSWAEARDFCVYIGGHLATVTSAEEDSFLYGISDGSAYFGLYKGSWVTNESCEYTNWGDIEPNNQGGIEHYGMYYAAAYPNGEWNDGDFEGNVTIKDTSAFLCEWEDVAKGDLDGDGETTVEDGRLALVSSLNGVDWAHADMNENGEVGLIDIKRIMETSKK